MTDSIAARVAALPQTPTPELKQMWRELFDREPPGFSRNYLISRLAYRIPMRFQRRGGRKRIVASHGSKLAPATKPQPEGALLKALARAWRWQCMLDNGVYATVSEIGDAESISKSYVSRILRLALLAPDIIEAILSGRTDQSMMLEQLKRPAASNLGGAARPTLLVNQ